MELELPSFRCPNCGKVYSAEEWRHNSFCINLRCGAYLTTNPQVVKTRVLNNRLKSVTQKSQLVQTSHIPEKFKTRLVEAHVAGSQILESEGIEPEPIETALTVEEHRWFWKPRKVKFVLVAESHVRTSGKEAKLSSTRIGCRGTCPREAL
jgi:hypothetical protein